MSLARYEWRRARGLRNALVALALASAASSAAAQVTDMERQIGDRMLGGVFWTLDSLYFDSTYGEPEFAEHWWPARETIRQASSWGEILGAIANALHGLKDSHTRFIPPGLTVAVNYGWRWRVVGDACYVVTVEDGSDAARKGLRVGDHVVAIDGLRTTPENLDVISYVYHELNPRDRMQVVVERDGGRHDTVAFEAKLRRRPPVADMSDLEARRRLLYEASLDPGLRHRFRALDSVAVWSFNLFQPGDGRIDRYMDQVRRLPWLILDLRGNGGGALETANRLLGHFTDSSYAAYRQVWRDSTTEWTVEPRRQGQGYRGRVLVLIDRESASSAELVAWTLKQRHGAALLGDRSAGKMRGSLVIPLVVGGELERRFYPYGVQVTVFDIVMPDGTRLEGTGVAPDALLLPTAEDLAAQRDPVMARALAMVGVTMPAEDAGRLLR